MITVSSYGDTVDIVESCGRYLRQVHTVFFHDIPFHASHSTWTGTNVLWTRRRAGSASFFSKGRKSRGGLREDKETEEG